MPAVDPKLIQDSINEAEAYWLAIDEDLRDVGPDRVLLEMLSEGGPLEGQAENAPDFTFTAIPALVEALADLDEVEFEIVLEGIWESLRS